jgi:hypothetical protein
MALDPRFRGEERSFDENGRDEPGHDDFLQSVIARSEATKQSRAAKERLDCFAELVIGPAEGRTRWLAMTARNGGAEPYGFWPISKLASISSALTMPE